MGRVGQIMGREVGQGLQSIAQRFVIRDLQAGQERRGPGAARKVSPPAVRLLQQPFRLTVMQP
jgi:hypothetical protein